jgi:hypothetical protein
VAAKECSRAEAGDECRRAGAAVDPLLVETVDVCSPSTFGTVERAETDGWSRRCGRARSIGLPVDLAREDVGRSGGSLADAMAVLRSVGRRRAGAGAETGVLGGWLAAASRASGRSDHGGARPCALTLEGGRLGAGDRGLEAAARPRPRGRAGRRCTADRVGAAGRPRDRRAPTWPVSRDVVRFDHAILISSTPAPPGVDGDVGAAV